jgi:hypothetical protein
MKTVRSASMSLEPKSSTKQVESIHHLGPKEIIPLEKIDPEAAETLNRAGLPLTKGNYFVLLFGDSEHEIDPEEYEILPPELRPAE